MSSDRAGFALRVGLSAGTAVLIMLGASLNASGRVGWSTGLAGVAGLLALAAGIVYRQWRLVVPAAGAAPGLAGPVVPLQPHHGGPPPAPSGVGVPRPPRAAGRAG